MVQRIYKNKHLLATAALLLSCHDNSRIGCNAFSMQHTTANQNSKRPFSSISQTKKKSSTLYIASIEEEGNTAFPSTKTETSRIDNTAQSSLVWRQQLQDFWLPVVWTSLLITSNTVGAGMLVLPELCEGPGMGLSCGLFVGLYLLNLVSGLLISEVAIVQKERSGQDAPSSFKAFAEENLDSAFAKDVIALVCVVKNALVLAFGTMKAGQLGHDLFGVNADLVSVAWVLAFAGLLGTQSAPRLSKVASVFVVGLFGSFATILIPGMAQMETPIWEVLTQPGTSSAPMTDLWQAAPIILMSFIFQNIVPTTARILDYDRPKIVLSMAIGTLFPSLMYGAWCLAVLGGGVDTAVGLEGPMFTLFSVVTIAGSHLGSSTSMSEELDTYLRSDADQKDRKNDVFSWSSVLITAAMGIGLGEGFSGNLNDLLSLAGAYGSPFLYFVLPLIMMSTQQGRLSPTMSELEETSSEPSFVPNLPLALTASAATGFVGLEALHML